MPEQRIVVIIDGDGKISAETEGIKGEVCVDELKRLLGEVADLESLSKTDEYYQQVELSVGNTQYAGRRQ